MKLQLSKQTMALVNEIVGINHTDCDNGCNCMDRKVEDALDRHKLEALTDGQLYIEFSFVRWCSIAYGHGNCPGAKRISQVAALLTDEWKRDATLLELASRSNLLAQ